MYGMPCPTCRGTWNPVFCEIVHANWCPSFTSLGWRKPSVDSFCPRCSSMQRDGRGSIMHLHWCWKDTRVVGGRCTECGSVEVRTSGSHRHSVMCSLYEPPPKAVPEKELYSEIKNMSVDGLIVRASKIAAEAHRNHTRKYSGDPYIYHPMRVAGRATLLMGARPVEIAMAWLHDTLEPYEKYPPPMTVEDLADRGMPAKVIEGVIDLTNPSSCIQGGNEGMNREKRKEMDRKWLSSKSVWVKKIKMIDRIDNLTELSRRDLQFLGLYVNESKLLIEAIGDADAELKTEALGLCDYWEKELSTLMHSEMW